MGNAIGMSAGMSAMTFAAGLDKLVDKDPTGGNRQLKLTKSVNCLSSKEFYLNTVKMNSNSTKRMDGTIGSNKNTIEHIISRLDLTNRQADTLTKEITARSQTPLTVASLRDLIRTAVPKPVSADPHVATANAVRDQGVVMSPVAGDRRMLPQTTSAIAVDVEFNDGNLWDLKKAGYLRSGTNGETYAGANVVRAGAEGSSPTHMGTHSLASCSPIIMLVTDQSGNVEVSVRHVSSFDRGVLKEQIAVYKQQGRTVEKIITGLHGTRHPRQIYATAACAQDAADLGIDFSVIKYDDNGASNWWVSVEVVDNANVKINMGSFVPLPKT